MLKKLLFFKKIYFTPLMRFREEEKRKCMCTPFYDGVREAIRMNQSDSNLCPKVINHTPVSMKSYWLAYLASTGYSLHVTTVSYIIHISGLWCWLARRTHSHDKTNKKSGTELPNQDVASWLSPPRKRLYYRCCITSKSVLTKYWLRGVFPLKPFFLFFTWILLVAASH